MRKRRKKSVVPGCAGAAAEGVLLAAMGVLLVILLAQRHVRHEPAPLVLPVSEMVSPLPTSSPLAEIGLQGAVPPLPPEPLIEPASTPLAAAVPLTDVVTYREMGGYRKFGQTWTCILVPPDTSMQELVRLALHVHRENPTMRYRFFDDDSAYEQYIAWYIDYPESGISYPGTWVRHHHCGVINVITRPDGSQQWRLITPYGETIANLEE